MSKDSETNPILTEEQITALIYRVAPQLTHERETSSEDQTIINCIAYLRRENKLTPKQEKFLDRIGLFSCLDTDEF